MACNMNNEDCGHETSIQAFYVGQSIFITGGTGFLGKILIEKLLRSCPDISTIYLLIRTKKNKNPESRLDDMFQSPIYDKLREKVPNFRNKVVPVIGEFNVDGVQISEEEVNLLIRNVSIVFHLAATVRFNEKFKTATGINVIGTRYILNLCKRMRNLKAFIHVSTLYANCHVKNIEEKFYEYPMNHEDLVMLTRILPEYMLDETIAGIMSQWPNSYTCTKAIAEDLIREENDNLPIGIFRPGAVTSTAREPMVGWIDNFYGPTGLMMPVLLGLMRFMLYKAETKMHFVPVDYTVNALIASAWDVFNHPDRRGKNMLIYNFSTSIDTPLTMGEYTEKLLTLCDTYPLSNSVWLPTVINVRQKMVYSSCIWLCHLFPALLIDAVRKCIGLQPRVWNLQNKIYKNGKVLSPFTLNEWNCPNDNVQRLWSRLHKKEQQLFEFNMEKFDWSNYLTACLKGMRLYLCKDDDSTLESSRTRFRRFYLAHQTLKTIFGFGIVWSIWTIFPSLFFRREDLRHCYSVILNNVVELIL